MPLPLLSLQFFVHYVLHLVAPLGLAVVFFRHRLRKAYAVLLTTMLVDIDHLWATPIFKTGRCSIGFHPFHTLPAIVAYLLLLIFGKGYGRVIAAGLLFHMFTDFIDCAWMYHTCAPCLEGQNILPAFRTLFS